MSVHTQWLGEQDASPATRIASPAQKRIALVVCLAMLLLTALLLPVAETFVPNFLAMWPASQMVMVMGYLITGYFIYSNYYVTGSIAYLYLSGSCFYTAGLMILQFLAMPGLLSPTYVLASEHTGSWLWSFWHGGVPIGIMLYALSEWRRPGQVVPAGPRVLRHFCAVVLLWIGISLAIIVGLHDRLPILIADGNISRVRASPLVLILPSLNLAALILLWRVTQFRTVLTVWLGVALLACLCDYLLHLAGGMRLSVGWYASRTSAMISSLVMLHVYVGEISRLYLQTVESAHQLRAANALLEVRVQERTAELVAAYRELSEQKSMLQSLSTHRDRIRERERKRIAQEIHDELGQNLMALRIDVSMMHARTGESHPKLHRRAETTLANLDATIKSVRAIINDLRPATLSLGLVAAVEWQAEQFKRLTGIECSLVVEQDRLQPELDEESTLALFRLLQESLTNIVRHARASAVTISLNGNPQQVSLTVADNGVGMNFDDVVKSRSFGLVGMRERIHSLGGKLNIDSGHGRGTVIVVSVPVRETAARTAPSLN